MLQSTCRIVALPVGTLDLEEVRGRKVCANQLDCAGGERNLPTDAGSAV
jgi:hypothetical protein